MAHRKWSLLLCLVCAVVAVSTGDEVLITTPHVTSSSQGKCWFPEVLSVELARPGSETGWTIPLKKDNIFQTERAVFFMSETDVNVLEEVKVTSNEHDGVQTYHNHHHGAAFLAKCVRREEERRYLLLEGSVFVNSSKYRITPSSNWSQSQRVFPSHVTAIYNMTYIEEFHARDSSAIFASSSSYLEKLATRSQSSARHKRDVALPATYYLDILTVIDSTFYATFYSRSGGDSNRTNNNILDYLANLFTAVSMRQNTLELESRTITIRLLTPVILKNSSQSPYNSSNLKITNNQTTIDAETLLTLFKGWLIGQENLGVYDHAMFITALDIVGGSDSGIKFNVTKGLAYLGTICLTNGESSSIISDNGAYQSEAVVAHEITHSLGSTHDGDGNACKSADRYIMSDGTYLETDANRFNPWKYSNCSSSYVLNQLKELEKNATILQTCLKDSSGNNKTVYKTLSSDEQCKLFFGNESYICRGGNLPSLDNICDEFYCKNPGKGVCERLTAATGTCCGAQKKCNQGRCVGAMPDECPWKDGCPFGDQPGEVLEGQTCAQLNPSHCYNNDIRLKCCDFCETIKTQNPDCLYGDKQLQCLAEKCGSNFSSGPYVNLTYGFVCCSTCNSTCNDGTVILKDGEYKCADYIIDKGNSGTCYDNRALVECCKSCEKIRNASNEGCPWGDKSNCSSLSNAPPGYNCTVTQLETCCHTCSLLSASTTAASGPATTLTPVAPSTGRSPNQATTTCKPTERCGATANAMSMFVLCLIAVVYRSLVKFSL